jgi:hypothetical protein
MIDMDRREAWFVVFGFLKKNEKTSSFSIMIYCCNGQFCTQDGMAKGDKVENMGKSLSKR